MSRLLIATTNPAKLAEYRLLLKHLPLELISPRDAGISDSAEETGDTFRDNALLKARFYFGRSGEIATLADDGGLEVDALGGAPGVRSHRWLGGGPASDRELADAVIARMEGIEKQRRSARLTAALALIYRDREKVAEAVAQASLEGLIAPRRYPEIREGFPYRAVLWLPDRACYVGELGEEEEARLSQRKIALNKLAPYLDRVAQLG